MQAGRPTFYIKFIAPFMIGLSALDSLLKEQAWVPQASKELEFTILGPVAAIGTILLIPYIRNRISIVTPKRISELVVGLAIGVSVIQVVVWALMYYQVVGLGSHSISSAALFLKYVALTPSVVVFGLLAARLLLWYGKTRNKTVLAFALFSLWNSLFSALHLLTALISSSSALLLDGIAAMFVLLVWSGTTALMLMYYAYYRRTRSKYGWLLPISFQAVSATIVVAADRTGTLLDPTLATILRFGLDLAGPTIFLGYYNLIPAAGNPVAIGYYKGVGYGWGILAAATCAIGLRIPTTYPLSGFPSLTMLLPGAALAFAGLTSSAAYFSISQEVRSQIRQSTDFVATLGEAQSSVATERKIQEFYDKFTGMAKASGAVEDAALTKDDIYSYAAALKKLQTAAPEK